MTYTWEAQYNDNSILKQIEESGEKHAYSDIDRQKLAFFKLKNENDKPSLVIAFDEDGEKLIWTRRIFRGPDIEATAHIVGKKGEFVLALCEDGSIIARHNFKDDGLFDEVINV